MATVDQLLRQLARQSGSVPYWVLEKDYALSYLLAGIATTPALHDNLILKGGTALRKGYFVDYRFSEDLDFSLRPDQSLPDVDNAVRHAVRQMELLLQRGPFEASVERLTLREPHPGSQDAFTVWVRFPTQRQALCRLKIEITRDELVLLPPATRPLLHSYPEELVVALWCYPLEEIMAEKLRALLQSRARRGSAEITTISGRSCAGANWSQAACRRWCWRSANTATYHSAAPTPSLRPNYLN